MTLGEDDPEAPLMTKTPKVSVIIPTHKPEFLKEALDSVFAQTLQDFDIVLVPNNVGVVRENKNPRGRHISFSGPAMSGTYRPLGVTLGERRRLRLEARVARPTSPQRVVLRARIVLAAWRGRSNAGIARELGISVDTVRKWRGRFVRQGRPGLADRPGPGPPGPAALAARPSRAAPPRGRGGASGRGHAGHGQQGGQAQGSHALVVDQLGAEAQPRSGEVRAVTSVR